MATTRAIAATVSAAIETRARVSSLAAASSIDSSSFLVPITSATEPVFGRVVLAGFVRMFLYFGRSFGRRLRRGLDHNRSWLLRLRCKCFGYCFCFGCGYLCLLHNLGLKRAALDLCELDITLGLNPGYLDFSVGDLYYAVSFGACGVRNGFGFDLFLRVMVDSALSAVHLTSVVFVFDIRYVGALVVHARRKLRDAGQDVGELAVDQDVNFLNTATVHQSEHGGYQPEENCDAGDDCYEHYSAFRWKAL
jgi:hypothetical protein